VAVGSDGDTLVADSAASTGLRWQGNYAAGKNYLINGDFRVNQRSFTSVSGTQNTSYGFDRWLNSSSGGGTATYTAQTFTLGSAPVSGYEGRNYIDIATTGQTATNVTTRLDQRIESVRTLANQTATISFWAKAASGTPKAAIELDQQFGTGGSPSTRVTTYAGQVTLSTSWARYSVTVSVPSISGKTIGTDGNDFLALNLWVSAGTDFNARTGSLGIQTNTFSLWGVQVEAGSVATAFQTATGTLQGELAACQRYYWRTGGLSAYQQLGTAYTKSATEVNLIIPNPVPMRGIPTSVDSSTLGFQEYAGTIRTMSAVTLDGSSSPTASFIYATIAGSTAGYVGRVLVNNSTSGFLGFSAEL
jgi:hypothetical protein